MPRRTVFAATVNHPKFLADDTGNSRWWTVAVAHIDWRHDVDMQQVFAQLSVELDEGARWWLTEEEGRLLDDYNRRHRTMSAIEEQLLDALDLERAGAPDLPAVTCRELLVLIGITNPTNPQFKECASVLREYLGESRRINGRDKWRVPLVDEWRKEWKPPVRDEFD